MTASHLSEDFQNEEHFATCFSCGCSIKFGDHFGIDPLGRKYFCEPHRLSLAESISEIAHLLSDEHSMSRLDPNTVSDLRVDLRALMNTMSG